VTKTKTRPAEPVTALVNDEQLAAEIRTKGRAILEAVDALAAAEDKETQPLIRAVHRSAQEFVFGFLSLDVLPASIGPLLRTFVDFADTTLATANELSSELRGPEVDQDLPNLSRQFLAAVHDLAAALDRPPAPTTMPPLESVELLDKQGVNHRQVARMYGWLDHRGEPEFWKVDEELKQPGRHVNEHWTDPRRPAHEAKVIETEKALAALERIARRLQSLGIQRSDVAA